jgi:exopolysaccharide biosynthesis polyprenyl glycosylphosphotransferase
MSDTIARGDEGRGTMIGEDSSLAYPRLHTSRDSGERSVLGRRNERLARIVLGWADLVAILGAFVIAHFVGSDHGPALDLILIATIPIWLATIKSCGLYDAENDTVGHGTLDEIPKLAWIGTAGAWMFTVFAWAVGRPLEMGQSVAFWLLLLALLPLSRFLARPVLRRDDNYPQNTLIVGAGTVGQLIGRKLLTHPEYRINLVGFVDAAPKERREDLKTLTILGEPDDLPELAEAYALERVIIAFSNDSHEETMDLIRVLKDLDVRIDIVPRLFDIIPPRLTSHTIEGIPLITLPRLRLSRWSRFLKRSFDVGVASAMLFILGPTLALVALLIKLDSSGPVFFRQLRMGATGPFHIYKFRTMVVNADAHKQDIAHLNSHAAPGGDPRMFKVREDPRVTRIGRILRRYSLDEFPQLLNVIKGDMSLIGPRPLILEEDQHVEAWARKRLELKPGMTGLWQVLGRNAIPFEDMVKLDYLYVTTWSLANDCKLLLQTVPVVLSGDRGTHW